MEEYDYLSLKEVERWEPVARAMGVSKVARSRRGFLTAYKAAGGKWQNLPMEWREERDGFLERHLAQLYDREEPLYKKGKPTRRHLALIMWAMSPDPKGLKKLFA